LVTLPALASSSSSFTLSCAVPPTGDLHPIYNAPMLGAHQLLEHDGSHARRGSRVPFGGKQEIDIVTSNDYVESQMEAKYDEHGD